MCVLTPVFRRRTTLIYSTGGFFLAAASFLNVPLFGVCVCLQMIPLIHFKHVSTGCVGAWSQPLLPTHLPDRPCLGNRERGCPHAALLCMKIHHCLLAWGCWTWSPVGGEWGLVLRAPNSLMCSSNRWGGSAKSAFRVLTLKDPGEGSLKNSSNSNSLQY